jgi:hypothetical protein
MDQVSSFTVSVSDGVNPPVERIFSITTTSAASGTLQFTADGSFTVPPGVFSVNIDWLIGAGAGGGAGTQIGSGGGGGGGGSGGWQQNVPIACAPGDVLTIHIGLPGSGNLPGNSDHNPVDGNGNPGGDTTITHGSDVYTASGGQGGSGSPNVNHGSLTAPGGLSGSPNGNAGQTGPAGTSDFASTPGAPGGAGPLAGAAGGAGGNAGPGTTGQDGTGYGSGGGGGGSYDRSGPSWFVGGSGVQGFVQISY